MLFRLVVYPVTFSFELDQSAIGMTSSVHVYSTHAYAHRADRPARPHTILGQYWWEHLHVHVHAVLTTSTGEDYERGCSSVVGSGCNQYGICPQLVIPNINATNVTTQVSLPKPSQASTQGQISTATPVPHQHHVQARAQAHKGVM